MAVSCGIQHITLDITFNVFPPKRSNKLSPCIYPLKAIKMVKTASKKESFVSNFATRAHTRKSGTILSLSASGSLLGHCVILSQRVLGWGWGRYLPQRKSVNLLDGNFKWRVKNWNWSRRWDEWPSWISTFASTSLDSPLVLLTTGEDRHKRGNNTFAEIIVCCELQGH